MSLRIFYNYKLEQIRLQVSLLDDLEKLYHLLIYTLIYFYYWTLQF